MDLLGRFFGTIGIFFVFLEVRTGPYRSVPVRTRPYPRTFKSAFGHNPTKIVKIDLTNGTPGAFFGTIGFLWFLDVRTGPWLHDDVV